MSTVNHRLRTLAFCTLQASKENICSLAAFFTFQNLRMHMPAVVLTAFLQQCNKALHGEPFSITISYGSAFLLPVVDVNGVLLVAAAPLQAFLTYVAPPPRSTQHCSPLHLVTSTLGLCG